jgi:predicted transposase/invertase (TIGR01784 family)
MRLPVVRHFRWIVSLKGNRRKPPILLSPLSGEVFKAMLTRPENLPVLCSFLSGILDLHIVSVTVIQNEPPASSKKQKHQRFDINCVTDSGEQIAIEMQVHPMDNDNLDNNHVNLCNRTLLSLCDLHGTQNGEGVPYSELKRTFQLTICDFTVWKDRPNYINRYQMRDEEGNSFSDQCTIVYLELTKLRAHEPKAVAEMTLGETWAYYLACACRPKYKTLIKQITKAKEEIRMAQDTIDSISQSERERIARHLEKMDRMDEMHEQAVWQRRGEAKGKAEGKSEATYAIAQNLLYGGFPAEMVSANTGLPLSEVLRLPRANP